MVVEIAANDHCVELGDDVAPTTKLAPLVVVNCDLRWTDIDVDETAAVLAVVLRDTVVAHIARGSASGPTNGH